MLITLGSARNHQSVGLFPGHVPFDEAVVFALEMRRVLLDHVQRVAHE
jgi:hypothetical protein